MTAPARLPRPLPVLGYALRFARAPLELVETLRPGGDVLRFRLGPQTVYWVNNPDLVRRVLADSTVFDKGHQADKLRVIGGNGLVTAYGDDHVRNRRLVQPAFHRDRIAGYVETMRQFTVDAIDAWVDGERIEADREFANLTLRVVGQTLFSTALGAEAVDEIVRSIPKVLHEVGLRLRDPIGLRGRFPTAASREFDATMGRLRDVVDRLIAQYREAGVDHGDVTSMLLLARDEETGESLSNVQVRDEVLTLLAAGTETSANVLAWAYYHLGQRPDLQTRLHREVDEVLGGREVAVADLPQLAFVRCLIMETLRLYPQAWILTRRTKSPVTLGGVDLPRGANIFFAPYAIQRDPAVYEDPDTFDPDRWADDRSRMTQRPSFVPFGGGRRQCIGDVFAMTELTVVLATIAQRWHLDLVPGERVQIDFAGTLKPDHLPMTPRRRA
jgi:cytochrome P450